MAGIFVIIGLFVMLSANETMPGTAIGGGFVLLGAIVFMVRGNDEF